MGFWSDHMPRGMLLRSAWGASHIADPRAQFTLDAYEAEQSQPFARPLPADEFARYGRWFQAHAVPDLDPGSVTSIDRREGIFNLWLADGRHLAASRVVLATGPRRFAFTPEAFSNLNSTRVLHSVDVCDPARFAGRRVIVIGAGQSAVEIAVLLHEAGSQVELIARAEAIRWLMRGEHVRRLSPIVRRILYAPTDVGPAGLSWVMATPPLLRRLPRGWQDRFSYRAIRPAATGWLFNRFAGVTTTFSQEVVAADVSDSTVRLRLSDDSEREADFIVLATGYRIDLACEELLAGSLRASVACKAGFPILDSGFESNVPGLHFVGAYAAHSHGPIMRFVSGTRYTSRAVARRLAQSSV